MEDISRSERETDCSSLENYVTTVSGGVAIRSRCFGTQAIRLGRKDPYPRFAGSFHRLERYANCKREKGQVSIPNVCVVRNLPFFLLPSSLLFPLLKSNSARAFVFPGRPPSPLFNYACQIEKERRGRIERSLILLCVAVWKKAKLGGEVTNSMEVFIDYVLFFFFDINFSLFCVCNIFNYDLVRIYARLEIFSITKLINHSNVK